MDIDDIGNVVGRLLIRSAMAKFYGLALIDLFSKPERWDIETDEATFEAMQRRSHKLAEIGSRRLVPMGLAAVSDGAGGSALRASLLAVTADDLVLLDANVTGDPDGELARIPRSDITGVRIVDEQGDPLAAAPPSVSEELDQPPDRRFALVLDSKGGYSLFAFRSLARAIEARDAIVEHALAR
jgi:hypothetical protein